jgi:Na+-transporting methylmalonyl-CoA/oxaloacetate decarboxylase gamma subunit
MFLAQQDSQPFFSLAPLTEEHGIPLAVMGILVVFTVLVLVVIYISVLPHILAPLSGRQQEEPTREPELGSDELSPETLVVIAAAVSEAMGRPHRIVQIRGLTSADLGWSLEGRMQHHHSHRIQPRAGR